MKSLSFTDKQKEYYNNANKRWNIKVGGTGTGKTFIDYTALIPKRTRQFKDVDGLYLLIGVTASTVERNVLQPMRELYGEGLVSYPNKGSGTVKLFGEVYHIIGAEKENATNKIQGMTVKYVYGDEFVNWNESFFKMLTTRMRATGAMADLTGNPTYPSHWAKQFIDKMIEDDTLYYQTSTIDDNPMLEKEFVRSQKVELAGTTEYTRLILGQWAVAEGVIYPMLSKDNVVSLKEWDTLKDDILSISIGVDFGGNKSKTAFQATGYLKGNKIITFAERRFEQDEDIDKINREFKKFIEDIKDMFDVCPPIRVIRLDSAEQVIINSMRTFASKDGYINPNLMKNARKGAILDRIRAYQRMINTKTYLILETCTITYEAFENAVWSDKTDSNGKDVRLDDGTVNIDTLDAQEYSTEELHKQLIRTIR